MYALDQNQSVAEIGYPLSRFSSLAGRLKSMKRSLGHYRHLGVLDGRRLALFCLLTLCTLSTVAQSSSLRLVYGAQGLQKLTYDGQTLQDLSRWPNDAFHIWHMKATDLRGHPLTSGQFGWGENHISRTFDQAAKTWHYVFSWGSILVSYKQVGDSVIVVVTTSNALHSGIVFEGATLYPITLHFPRIPVGFEGANRSLILGDIEEPAVVIADYGDAEVTALSTDQTKPMYLGFQGSGKDAGYAAIVSSTPPDGYHEPQQPGRMLLPGQRDTFTIALRFTPAQRPAEQTAPEAYKAFAERYPETLRWSDRRMIGTVFLASSPQDTKLAPGSLTVNPRHYFAGETVNTLTPDGIKQFQVRVLRQAAEVVRNLKRLNAQGVITWDIEGEQYPQNTSYACSPDQIAILAPEMESIVQDKTSQHAGMKLDDAYFKTIRDAGFRIGVCVRPQRLAIASDGTAHQVTLQNSEVAANLIHKMKYAHDRWGATIFYLDSTVEADGRTLPASIIETAAAALPDSLLIPEESTPRMYRAAAPFQSFLFHGDIGTPSAIRALFPHAFSVNLVNDVNPDKLAEHSTALTEAVARGDLLMLLSSYWQANNATAMSIYRAAPTILSGK